MRCLSRVSFAFVSYCIAHGTLVSSAIGEDQSGKSTLGVTARQARLTISQAESDPAPAPLQPIAPRATPSMPQRQTTRFSATGAAATQSMAQPLVTNQTRQALGFYGGASARATLSQFPRRTPIQPSAPRVVRRQTKPFQNVERDPTISPYVHLDRDEDESEGIPNYFTFVRPQMEQLHTNRMQQRDIQQIRGQLQSISSTVVAPQYQSGPVGGRNTPARFMDTAQFYGGLR